MSLRAGHPLAARGRGARALREDEGGQLMLLAGIVITIAFLLTSLTLSQVSSLERQAAAEKPTSLMAEWRFLHDRLGTNLESAVPPDLKLDTFKSTTFPTIAATFRNIEAEKGFDATLRLADDPAVYEKTEYELTEDRTVGSLTSRYYNAWPSDGATHLLGPYDGLEDGVLWYSTCPDTEHVGGCIAGVLVFVEMTDGTSTMSEVILFSVNRAAS